MAEILLLTAIRLKYFKFTRTQHKLDKGCCKLFVYLFKIS